MEPIELKTTVRTSTGNSPARALRRQGRIPAVLYGPGKAPVLLSIDKTALEQVLKKGETGQLLLNLVIQNGKKSKKIAMIKELQTNPVSRGFLHVDFYEIAMDRKIRVNVPVTTKGIANGVEIGGTLQIVRRELEVLCLPGDIPETFEIDISDLDIGESVHVEEIPCGEGVEIQADTNFTVITVVSPTKEPEPEEEVEAEDAEAEAEAEGEAEAEDSPDG